MGKVLKSGVSDTGWFYTSENEAPSYHAKPGHLKAIVKVFPQTKAILSLDLYSRIPSRQGGYNKSERMAFERVGRAILSSS